MDWHKVFLNESQICQGLGAFANQNINNGDLIEYGVARVLNNVDGHENPILFHRSDTIPNQNWALLFGCAHFYNTSLNPNTEVIRDFQNNTFKIKAIQQIKKGDELTHRYKSFKSEKWFSDLKLK